MPSTAPTAPSTPTRTFERLPAAPRGDRSRTTNRIKTVRAAPTPAPICSGVKPFVFAGGCSGAADDCSLIAKVLPSSTVLQHKHQEDGQEHDQDDYKQDFRHRRGRLHFGFGRDHGAALSTNGIRPSGRMLAARANRHDRPSIT